MKIDHSAKELVTKFTKQAYADKLFAGTSGNLSVYDREQGVMYITPTSYPYELLTPDDIVPIDNEGNVLEGTHRPSSEWRMHMEIYKAYPHVNAVVHTHSPYATAFAVNHREIPVILIEMVAYLGGEIPLADFALPGTVEVGTEAVKAMGEDKTCCLLANHGALAYGADLLQAHTRAVYVEDAARIYSLALSNGEAYTVPDESIEAMKARKKAARKES